MDVTPHLLAVSNAVPSQRLDQADVAEAAARVFSGTGEFERLRPVYANAGVERRWTPVNLAWFAEPHGWADRNAVFQEAALDLLQEAAERCLAESGRQASDVDAVVVACTTGFAAPSLDALLIDRLGLRRDVERLPIFGLGCAGGVLGLARAAALSRARPGSLVLFLTVELCSLTFRLTDRSKSNIVATALFGDGAAGALVSTQAGDGSPAVAAWGEHTWPNSASVMGWNVEDDGFGVVFSPEIPRLILRGFGEATDSFLAKHGLTRTDLAGYIMHPGGEKVASALERVFGLQHSGLVHEREVLRHYGNMSAPTVLFVLKRHLTQGSRGRYLMGALGPGFTAAFMLLDLA